MLNVVVKVVQVAVGAAVGCLASDAVDKVIESVQKAVKSKKGEA